MVLLEKKSPECFRDTQWFVSMEYLFEKTLSASEIRIELWRQTNVNVSSQIKVTLNLNLQRWKTIAAARKFEE